MIPREQPILYSADFGMCEALGAFDAPAIAEAFAATLRAAGATVVEQTSHAFPGGGVTCVLILKESHAVVHTWPETATINVDIFSCSTRLKSLAALDALGRLFGAQTINIQETCRADGHLRVPARARA